MSIIRYVHIKSRKVWDEVALYTQGKDKEPLSPMGGCGRGGEGRKNRMELGGGAGLSRVVYWFIGPFSSYLT